MEKQMVETKRDLELKVQKTRNLEVIVSACLSLHKSEVH
jgi:hypothetical protein